MKAVKNKLSAEKL